MPQKFTKVQVREFTKKEFDELQRQLSGFSLGFISQPVLMQWLVDLGKAELARLKQQEQPDNAS